MVKIPLIDLSSVTNPLLLGDTHWGARSDSALFHNYMSKYFDDMFDECKKRNITHIIQFGDLFDRRKYINFITLQCSKKNFFDKIRSNGLKMIVMIGNHDTPYKNTIEVNSVDLLLQEYSDCITIIQQPTEIQFANNIKALVVPWICTDNQDISIKSIKKTDAQLCFGHFEIAGFEMYKGAICEHGVDLKIFNKFEHVYSGHFHHVSTKGNITYIGSPYQLTWADYGDDRGSFELDTSNLTTDFIPNKHIMFNVFDYDDTDLTVDVVDKINFGKFTDSYVKVKILKNEKPLLLESIIDKFNQARAITHTVDLTKNNTVVIDNTVIEADDIQTTFKNYLKSFDEQDQPAMYSILIDLYSEASNQTAV